MAINFGIQQAYSTMLESAKNKSVLDAVIQQIFDSTDLEQAKELFVGAIRESAIPVGSKLKMFQTARTITDLDKMKQYASNSRLDKLGLKTYK